MLCSQCALHPPAINSKETIIPVEEATLFVKRNLIHSGTRPNKTGQPKVCKISNENSCSENATEASVSISFVEKDFAGG